MNYTVTNSSAFPVVEVTLQPGEEVLIESGAMVYHNSLVKLESKMNSNGGKGLGGLVKSVGRAITSSESMFITTVTGLAVDGKVGIAPDTPGSIRELPIGQTQWRLNDGAFFASDTTVGYDMKRQELGKAIFGKSGGLFVMETTGYGQMLINAYGDILEFELDGKDPFVADNMHVLAWSTSLNYNIKPGAKGFGLLTSGEGLVNEFVGRGTVLLQTRNKQGLAAMVSPYITSKN